MSETTVIDTPVKHYSSGMYVRLAFAVAAHRSAELTAKPGAGDIAVKRSRLIKHLRAHGAFLLQEGKRHSIYRRGNLKTQVPRHNEIVDELAR